MYINFNHRQSLRQSTINTLKQDFQAILKPTATQKHIQKSRILRGNLTVKWQKQRSSHLLKAGDLEVTFGEKDAV